MTTEQPGALAAPPTAPPTASPTAALPAARPGGNGPATAPQTSARTGFLARAFGVTALLSAAGSALGLLRDLLLARYFGANQGTDAFLVAWTVPETAAPLLIEDAMAFLMVPAFSLALVLREERPDQADPVRQLVRATLPWLLPALCTLAAAVALAAPQLVDLLAPGLADPALAITCTRITAFTVLPFGITGYLGSALRAHHGFTAPAAIYVAYNLGILTVLSTCHAMLGIRSAAVGVALGSLLMAGVLIAPFCRRLRQGRRPEPRRGGAGLVLMPLALLPVATFTLTRQAQVFIERFLGSDLPAGTISHLNYAAKVSQLAMTAAILICTVTFPLVARALAAGDLTAARDRVEKDLGQAAALVLAGTAFLIACAPSVVSLLFERGAFGPHDTAATAAAMRIYSLGLPAQALTGVMIRPYFSLRPVVRRADDPQDGDTAALRTGRPRPGHPTTGHPTTGHPTTGHPTTSHPTTGHPTTGGAEPPTGGAEPPTGGRKHPATGRRATLLDWYPVAAMAVGLLVTTAVTLATTPHIGAPGIAAGNAAGITATAALLMRGLLLRGIALRLPKVLGGQARLLAAAAAATAAGTAAGTLSTDPLPAILLGGLCVVLVFAVLGTAFGAAEVRGPLLALARALYPPPPAAEGKLPHGR
ncbi:lipid II flippase MurJ [Saccharothrix sp. ST-888]|uniref:lipid II flippase MurJ n=1 Tax=Saccharothrix sp. ST-888 TaxID=1427391 RepID=UPI0006964CB7|nr:lipid II flippase MurJ [Saccharothrix sp. ST-888]